MCLISVPNLKNPSRRRMFFWLKVIVLNWCELEEEENMKKIGQFLEIHISRTTWPIFLKFGMPSRVYGGHKIPKFDRNRSSSYRDARC